MKVKVEYFAIYSELLGKQSEELDLSEGTSVQDLFLLKTSELNSREDLLESTVLAVNSEYVEGDHLLQDGDEVVFIPPVSGG